MQVTLISWPEVDYATLRKVGWTPPEDFAKAGDILGEVGGRVCYRSWNRPNPATATNRGYLRNILAQKHFSVLEHAQYVFHIADVARTFTHELVRHRHLQPSQQSQRYVDERFGTFVVPPELAMAGVDPTPLLDAHQAALDLYEKLVQQLTEKGVTRKRARQAARSVLPGGHATELIMSGNLNAWRTMLGKRLAVNEAGEPLADLEFFQFGQWVLCELEDMAPNSMQDLWDWYQGWLATKPNPLLVIEPMRSLYAV